jgi:hypothetical protein
VSHCSTKDAFVKEILAIDATPFSIASRGMQVYYCAVIESLISGCGLFEPVLYIND